MYKEVLETSTTESPHDLDRMQPARFYEMTERYKLGGFGKDILHSYVMQ